MSKICGPWLRALWSLVVVSGIIFMSHNPDKFARTISWC